MSCPDSNPTLPIPTLPKLTIDPGNPQPGQSIKFNFSHDEVRTDESQLYAAWFDDLEVKYTDLNADDTASVPDGLQGTIYGAIVKDKADSPTAQEILTGLVMFEVGFPSYVANP